MGKDWTTRDLFREFSYMPCSDWHEAVVEFSRRYGDQIKKSISFRTIDQLGMDRNDYLQYIVNFIIAYKIGYLALFVSSLPDDLDDATVDSMTRGYLAKIINSARCSLLEEQQIGVSIGTEPGGMPEETILELKDGRRRVRGGSAFIDGETSDHDGYPKQDQKSDPERLVKQKPTDPEPYPDGVGKMKKRIRTVAHDSQFGRAQTDSWERDPAALAAESDERNRVIRDIKFINIKENRDRVVYLLMRFHDSALDLLSEFDWEYLEKSTGLPRIELEMRIREAAIKDPGRVVHAISAEFVADLLSLSKANVYKIVSRVKRILPNEHGSES